MRYLILMLLSCVSMDGLGQSLFEKHRSKEIDSLMNQVDFLLSDDWFVERVNDGFDVYFCRSCQERYLAQEPDPDYIFGKPRELFFEVEQADSVAYFTYINGYCYVNPDLPDSVYHAENLRRFSADDRLKFEIRFVKAWSDSRRTQVQEKNDELKEAIMEEGLQRTNEHIFSDYRYWLPIKRWQWDERVSHLNYWFERMPYQSTTLEQDILIIPDAHNFFCEPMYVDRNDEFYYENKLNKIEPERRRALHIIALVLGVPDYKVVVQ